MIGAGANLVRKVTTLRFITVKGTSLALELRREDFEICEEEIEGELINTLDLTRFVFSSQNFLYLVYPTEKRLPYFIQYLYTTSHCATGKRTSRSFY